MKRQDNQVFSMSFLDIMSCGFGALVLILLISQFKTYDSNNTDASEKILETLQTIDLLELEIENLKNSNNNLSNFVNELNTKLSAKESLLNSVMGAATAANASNQSKVASINSQIDNQKNLKRAINNAGGINVDSDYVVFIVDNSGSMIQFAPWQNVIKEIEIIIDAFPTIKGFQILNDQGRKMINTNKKWLEDNDDNRRLLKSSLKNPTQLSLSNPMPALKIALNRYANGIDDVGIFIFGDDIQINDRTADAYKEINNINNQLGKPKARINAIAFPTAVQYPILENSNIMYINFMRQLTEANGGSVVVVN